MALKLLWSLTLREAQTQTFADAFMVIALCFVVATLMVPLMRKVAAPAAPHRMLIDGPEGRPLEPRNATVAVIGAGDFIGSAIARKFAAEGFTVFAGRRNGEKLAPLVADVEAQGGRIVARSLDARQEDGITAFLREADALRSAGGLHLQCRRQRAISRWSIPPNACSARCGRWRAMRGFLAGREAARLMLPRGQRRDLLHRCDGQPARRRRLRRIRGCQGRAAGGRAECRARTRTEEHPRGASDDRCRRGYRVGARTDQGAGGRGGIGEPRSRPADAPGVGRRGVLAALSAATRCVDVRAGNPAVRRKMVSAMSRVEFHFDFGSPNAYLSHLVIPEIERADRGDDSIRADPAGRRVQADQQPLAGRNLAGIRNKPEYQRLETARFVQRHGITRYRREIRSFR